MSLFTAIRNARASSPKRERIAILMNGVGTIVADLENHRLFPASVDIAFNLWKMVKRDPVKALKRMDTVEEIADDHLDYEELDSFITWGWDLPVPEEYTPCPRCSC